MTKIGHGAFWGCCALTSIEIPNSMTSIESATFNGCSGLTSIEISDSVIYIATDAFEGCSSLKEIHLRNEHPENIKVDYWAFEDLSNCTLFVPIGTGYAYRHDWRFDVFKEVKIER